MFKTIVRETYQLAEELLVRPTIDIFLNLRDGTVRISARSMIAVSAAVIIVWIVVPRDPPAVNTSEPGAKILETSNINY
ncbi:hypothetical protein [Methylobacterium pseudosasicola]|uniref:Uncharacterized protein n=1 Tax=Methylobacterium pseudosasicola TaxID=582667 RepID=A0A1I4PSF9_9HYPH|nr:hypothetical protein [Methylobacterium pseudosasicola]SFM30811.1 hypothetical protein SAMN05192568_102639 [Methylobacterium pseudosasicola]